MFELPKLTLPVVISVTFSFTSNVTALHAGTPHGEADAPSIVASDMSLVVLAYRDFILSVALPVRSSRSFPIVCTANCELPSYEKESS